jgi:hypothetical protein
MWASAFGVLQSGDTVPAIAIYLVADRRAQSRWPVSVDQWREGSTSLNSATISASVSRTFSVGLPKLTGTGWKKPWRFALVFQASDAVETARRI